MPEPENRQQGLESVPTPEQELASEQGFVAFDQPLGDAGPRDSVDEPVQPEQSAQAAQPEQPAVTPVGTAPPGQPIYIVQQSGSSAGKTIAIAVAATLGTIVLLGLIWLSGLQFGSVKNVLKSQTDLKQQFSGLKNGDTAINVQDINSPTATVDALHVGSLKVDDLGSIKALLAQVGVTPGKPNPGTGGTTGLTVTGAVVVNGTTTVTQGSNLSGLVSSGQVKLTGDVNDTLLIQPSSNHGQNVFTVKQTDGTNVASLDANGQLVISKSTAGSTLTGDLYASRQALFTGLPSGSGVNQGSVYIDPATAGAGDTLLGLAVGGSQKLRVDGSGNVELSGNLVINGTTICDGTGCVTQGTAGGPLTASSIHNTGVLTQDGAATLGNSLSVAGPTNLQGNATVGGALSVTGGVTAASFSGNGTGLTGVDAATLGGNAASYYTNASNLVTGTLGDSLLSVNVTKLGNAVNGANDLVQLDGTGKLPAINGSALTAVNASQLGGQGSSFYLNAGNLNTGTLSDTRLSANVTIVGNTFNGINQLVQTTAGGKLPALDGSLVTNINAATLGGNAASFFTNAANLTGTLSDSRLSNNVTLGGNNFNAANGLVQLDGSGRLPAIDGSQLTNLPTGGTCSGCVNLQGSSPGSAQTGNINITGTIIAGTFSGNGSGLTAVNAVTLGGQAGSYYTNATNLVTGTVSDSRLSGNVTKAGNTFNGNSQLVQTDSSGRLPAIDGSQLTNLPTGGGCSSCVNLQASTPGAAQTGNINVSGTVIAGTFAGSGASLTNLQSSQLAGTINDARLSTNVTLAGNTFNVANGLVALTPAGKLPALDGSLVTSVNALYLGGQDSTYYTNAGNQSAGTLPNARLSSSVTLQGNSFNGANQLVQLSATAKLPVLDGSALTNLSAGSLVGTISTGNLPATVTLAGNSFNGANDLVKLTALGKLPALDGSALTGITASCSSCVQLQSSTPGTVQTGNINITGAIIAGTFAGDGNGLTDLNAGALTTGTISTGVLPSAVTLAGNSFNGNSQLVQTNSSGQLPGLDGSNLTNVDALTLGGHATSYFTNASNLSSGQVSDGLLSGNVTLQGNSFNGASELVMLDINGNLPAVDGSAILNLTAANLTGTIPTGSLPASVTTQGNSFNGNSQLIQTTAAGKLPALNGSLVTGVNAAQLNGQAASYYNDAANLTGTINNARLSSGVTIQGNIFNGNSQLVQLTAGGLLPVLNGSNLTSVNAATLGGNAASYYTNGSNISSGTVGLSFLPGTLTNAGNSFNGISQLVQLDGAGKLTALNGSALTNLNASNLATGTVNDSLLSGNVTKAGNTFNGVSQLVQTDGSGRLPALDGSLLTNLSSTSCASCVQLSPSSQQTGNINISGTITAATFSGSGASLTSLNGSNISSGTISSGRLDAATVPFLNTTNLFKAAANSATAFVIQRGTTTANLFVADTASMAVTVNGAFSATTLSGDGTGLTNVNAATLGGQAGSYYLNAGNLTGSYAALNGSAITNLSGGNITGAGSVSDTVLSANVTLQGNTFNGNSQLVKLTAAGKLPVLDGSALTNLSAANLIGTLPIGTLPSAVTTQGNTFNGNSQLVQLTAGGLLPTLNASNLTNLTAANLTGSYAALNGSAITNLSAANLTGTISNGNLSASVTLQGNTFNGNSQLVQTTAGGKLPLLDGSNLTSLTAGNLTGTYAALNGSAITNITAGNITGANGLSDSVLSTNVPLKNGTNTFTGTNTFQNTITGTFTGTQNLAITSPLAGNVNIESIVATPSATAGTTSGLFIQQAASANTNGLDSAFTLDNANTTLAVGSAINITNTGGGGYTNYISAPNFTVTGAGAVTATSFSGSGAGLTSIPAGNLTGSYAALNGSAITSLNGSNISSGTVATARLDATTVTEQGNTFNGNSQLVQTTAGGALPTLSGANLTSLTAANLTGTYAALNGSAITNLTAANLTGAGTLPNGVLSNSVTIQGNTFNGISQLVQLDGTGKLTALNGSALTNLTAGNLTGSYAALNGSAITNLTAGNLTGSYAALNGSAITNLSAANVTGANALSDAVLSTNVPLKNAANTYTNSETYTFTGTQNLSVTSNLAGSVNIESIIATPSTTAGTTNALFIQQAAGANTNGLDNGMTFDNANASTAVGNGIQFTNTGGAGYTNYISAPSFTVTGAGAVTASSFSGSGASLTSLPAANLTGSYAALNGSAITNLTAGNLTGSYAALNGSAITNLTAANLTGAGTLPNGVLSASVTLQGNTFNGSSQLVQTTAGGALPTLSGANLTNLSAGNLTGTYAALNGSAITNLTAANLTGAGTLPNGVLSASVTLAGNTFNGNSQLLQLTAAGKLPVLDGSNLTNLTAANLTGTYAALNGSAITNLSAANVTGANALPDAVLSANVALKGSSNTFTAANIFQNTITAGFSGTQNLAITSPLAGSVNVVSVIATPSTTAGTTAGMYVQQAPSANSNGLDSAYVVDNANTSLLIGNAIQITNSGAFGPGYSNYISAPNFSVTGLGVVTGSIFSGSGASLTSLNATNITSGQLADSELSNNITKQGNSFNGSSQLVQTTAGGALPVLSGANLSSLTAANLTGTYAALNGSAITNLSGGNISGNINIGASSFTGASATVSTLAATGALSIDSGTTSTGITIGNTNANALSLSRTGITTTVNGALAVTQATTLSGGLVLNSTLNSAGQSIAAINATPGSGSGTSNGLAIAQSSTVAVNGLTNALSIDNANGTRVIGAGIALTNTGGAGYTSYITAPNYSVTGAGVVNSAAENVTGTVAATTVTQKDTTDFDVRAYGAQCVGSGDDTTAIQNAINAAATAGGRVVFPAGSCMITSTLNITSSSISLVGAGSFGNADVGATTTKGTTLVWGTGSASANPILKVSAVIGGSNQNIKAINIGNMNIECAGNAAIGVQWLSVQYSSMHDMYFRNCSTASLDLSTVAGALGEATDTTRNEFRNLVFRQLDGTGGNAIAIRMDGSGSSSPLGNTSENNFYNIQLTYAATSVPAMQLLNSDSNRFYGLVVNKSGACGASNTTPGVSLGGGATAAASSRANEFFFLDPGPCGIIARGAASGFTVGSQNNVVWGLNLENNNILPTVEAGASINYTADRLTQNFTPSFNFGAMSSQGAYIQTTDTYGQEFAASSAVTGATAGSHGAQGDDGKWYHNGSSTTTTGIGTATTGGYYHLSIPATTGNGDGIFEGATAGTLDKVLQASNLPVIQMKVRPSVVNATNDVVFGMMDQATSPTANDTLPANGIFFWTNNSTGATGWQGVVRTAGANIGTPVTCPGVVGTNFATGRIVVESASSVHFYIDNDATDGISMLDCGIVSGTPPAAALALGMYDAHTVAAVATVDLDYARWWQDDAPASGASSSTSPALDGTGSSTAADLSTTDPSNTPAANTDAALAGGALTTSSIDNSDSNATITLGAGGKLLLRTAAGETPLSIDGQGNAVLSGAFSSGGALNVGGDFHALGLSVFEKMATFFGKVIFNQDVAFNGRATFNSDSGGFARIVTGQQSVHVSFQQQYAQTPVVSATLGNGQFAVAAVDNVTTSGFDIVLQQPASSNLTFNWIALAVQDARTSQNGQIPSTPQPTPVIVLPSDTPTPTSTPGSSPN